jgi:hypothetical protein
VGCVLFSAGGTGCSDAEDHGDSSDSQAHVRRLEKQAGAQSNLFMYSSVQ